MPDPQTSEVLETGSDATLSTRLGRVEAVQANPAHDLLVLDSGALIPIVFVVDTQPGVVTVDVPDGLLEL